MPQKINNQIFFNQNKRTTWEVSPIVIAWKFSSAENLGALLRVCDNFGIKQVFFVGKAEDYKISKIKRNATGSMDKVQWEFISESAIWERLPAEFLKIAIDTTSNSVSLNQYDFTKAESSFCLFFGNETVGLEDDVIQKSETSVHIPMVGESLSMNVVNAASVVLYEAVKQCLIET